MRIQRNKNILISHITKYLTIYIFTLILFMTGIIFGAIIVNSISFEQKENLFFYLERFFQEYLLSEDISKRNIFQNAWFYHIQFLCLLFFLGLSVIGLPIIWFLLFIKGIAIGFTVGFFVNQLGFTGLLFSISSIASQNIIIIPIYLVASSLAMIFSLTLLQSIFAKRYKQPIIRIFYRYISIFVILLIAVSIAAIAEAVISLESMRIIANQVIK